MANCYKLEGGQLVEAADPIADASGGYDEAVYAAGYRAQASSQLPNGTGAEVTLYESEVTGKPRFYVDIMGRNQTIATLVANDFPGLVAIMKEVQPLLALVGLDQRADLAADEHVNKDFRR